MCTIRDGDHWAAFFTDSGASSPVRMVPTVALSIYALAADAEELAMEQVAFESKDFTVIDYTTKDGAISQAVRLPTPAGNPCWFVTACGAGRSNYTTLQQLLTAFDREYYGHSDSTVVAVLR